MIGFFEEMLMGFSSGFEEWTEYKVVSEACAFLKDFVEENEDLIRGTVPGNDGEALFWFGRAMWNTIYAPNDALSLQSRVEDEPNFQPMLEFLEQRGWIGWKTRFSNLQIIP